MNAPFRKGQPFEPYEDEFIRSLVEQGKNHRQIAKYLAPILSRTEAALQVRACRFISKRKPTPPLVLPSLTIQKDDLLAYFELGWQIAWFEGDQVGIEWRFQSPTRMPVR